MVDTNPKSRDQRRKSKRDLRVQWHGTGNGNEKKNIRGLSERNKLKKRGEGRVVCYLFPSLGGMKKVAREKGEVQVCGE